MAETSRVGARTAGPKVGTTGAPAEFRRVLRARGTLSPALNFADDGDSGTSGRGERDTRGFAASGQATLAAAALLGVTEFYRIGGAQAIAALAYGTKSVPRVNKIVGPGNLFVTTAKKLVAFDCAIDFLAGPTEGLILCDDGEPSFLASDLVAQAEHDPEALVILITKSRKFARSVSRSVAELAQGNAIAAAVAAKARGAILLATSATQGRLDKLHRAGTSRRPRARSLPGIVSAGSIFHRRLFGTGGGGLRIGAEPCAADRRRRAFPRRVERARLRQGHDGAGNLARGFAKNCAVDSDFGGGRGASGSRPIDRIEVRPCLKRVQAVRKLKQYQPPLGDRSGLRLDFNENTGGCSPRVMERLRQIQPDQTGPLSGARTGGTRSSRVPGIAAGAVAADQWRGRGHSIGVQAYLEPKDQAVIVVPTFAMYQICMAATGATVISIPADEDFRFPTSKVMAHTTRRRRA